MLITGSTAAIDWGNSSLKVGWFQDGSLQKTGHFDTLTQTAEALRQNPPAHVIVSSTSRPAAEVRTQLTDLGGADWLLLTGQTPAPITNAYETPQTLGADRLAAAVGAVRLFPGRNCLILDLGTCLTADFVDAGGTFRGGLIAPGLRMRLRAMHEFTARLPLVEPEPDEALPLAARNTRQAMVSGAVNGLAFELNGLIGAYQSQPDLAVLLCGGDAPTFESRLKGPIFAIPELVLWGLTTILEHNVRLLQAD
jgi:type III pantothenate kinase